jgi:hypothetical protein
MLAPAILFGCAIAEKAPAFRANTICIADEHEYWQIAYPGATASGAEIGTKQVGAA